MTHDNYFNIKEDEDSNLLVNFNEDQQWFSGLTGNPQYAEVDYKADDIKGRRVHLELKQRKGTIDKFINQYKTVLIEPSKVAAFTRIQESGYTNGEKVLYVNFVDDGVILFDVDKIPYYVNYPNHFQRNFGKGEQNINKLHEHETRLGIPMTCAIIFKRDKNGHYTRYIHFKKSQILS